MSELGKFFIYIASESVFLSMAYKLGTDGLGFIQIYLFMVQMIGQLLATDVACDRLA